MAEDSNKKYEELKKRYEELETRYLIEREEHRKAKNHLMSVLNSRSFRLGKAIMYVPHRTKRSIKSDKDKYTRALKKIYNLNDRGRIAVGLITRDGTERPTSSAFLRLISPLTYGNAGNEIATRLLPDNTRTVENNIDVCIAQRTAVDNLGSARTLVKDLSDKKVKLVVDTDDNFSGLDPNHPQFIVHAEAVAALNYLKEHADRIWVSTDKLASNFNDKKSVMKNSVDDRLWRLQKRPILNDQKIKAVYMGTGTHDKDFALILPALDKINSKYPNSFELTLFGVTSKMIETRGWLHTRPVNMMYPYFVKWFQQQNNFDIGLAPLEDNEFNRAKSDIKVLDYLCTGVLPIVSDIEPYKNPGLKDFVVKVGYGSDDWFKALEDVILNREKYQDKKADTQDRIEKYLFGERSVNHVSTKILNELEELIV